MKKIILIGLLVLIVLISGCVQEKPIQEDKLIKDLIAKEESEQQSTIKSVEKCVYKGQITYHLIAGCCDFFNGVYNKNGGKICSTGGITGKGDSKCLDFFEERKDCKVIWRASSSLPAQEKECVTEQDCINSGKCSVGIECTCYKNRCYAGLVAEEECTTDADCSTGGCSGQICGQKDKVKGIITTCEWSSEYECYQLTDCSCTNGKCGWKETEEFLSCVKSHR